MKKILFILMIVGFITSCSHDDFDPYLGDICNGVLPHGRSFTRENYNYGTYELRGINGDAFLYVPAKGCCEILLLPSFASLKIVLPPYLKVKSYEADFYTWESLAWWVESDQGGFWLRQGGRCENKDGTAKIFKQPEDSGSSENSKPYQLPEGLAYTGENYAYSGYSLKGVTKDMFLYQSGNKTPELLTLPAFSVYAGSIPSYITVTKHEAIMRTKVKSLAWRFYTNNGTYIIIQGGAFLDADENAISFTDPNGGNNEGGSNNTYTGENYTYPDYTLKGLNGNRFEYVPKDGSKSYILLLSPFSQYSGSIPHYVNVHSHAAYAWNSGSLCWKVSSSQGEFYILQGGAFKNKDGSQKIFNRP